MRAVDSDCGLATAVTAVAPPLSLSCGAHGETLGRYPMAHPDTGGITFGGVVSFIFADLIILPILLIYRRYYGTRTALFIAGTFYATTVAAGYAVEVLFGLLHLVPHDRTAKVVEASLQWNYTTLLNLAFLIL